jgi:RNA polymerase sigma factor (TIGR02999 family)
MVLGAPVSYSALNEWCADTGSIMFANTPAAKQHTIQRRRFSGERRRHPLPAWFCSIVKPSTEQAQKRRKNYHHACAGCVYAAESPPLMPGSSDPSGITGLLRSWAAGDRAALEQLTPLVYSELRAIAAGYMHGERPGHLLQTTALVHEAYLKLSKAGAVEWQDRGHFFAASARVMRPILVDHARAAGSAKRGGGRRVDDVSFDTLPAMNTDRPHELCALDEALTALTQLDPRRAQVVELRYFGGLTVEETAEAMDISPQTVMRDWKVARAWLTQQLRAH